MSNANGLNTLFKKQRLSDWKRKKESTIYYLKIYTLNKRYRCIRSEGMKIMTCKH